MNDKLQHVVSKASNTGGNYYKDKLKYAPKSNQSPFGDFPHGYVTKLETQTVPDHS